jgi:drug/metabolite transporter (DMT)-like permease
MPAMNATRIVGLLLLIAGVLAVAYGGFSYTKETTAVKLGPVELSVKEQERVNVPMWAGIGAIVVGGVLIFVGGKRS